MRLVCDEMLGRLGRWLRYGFARLADGCTGKAAMSIAWQCGSSPGGTSHEPTERAASEERGADSQGTSKIRHG